MKTPRNLDWNELFERIKEALNYFTPFELSKLLGTNRWTILALAARRKVARKRASCYLEILRSISFHQELETRKAKNLIVLRLLAGESPWRCKAFLLRGVLNCSNKQVKSYLAWLQKQGLVRKNKDGSFSLTVLRDA